MKTILHISAAAFPLAVAAVSYRLAAVYAVLSAVSFVLYGIDKRRACSPKTTRRIAERSLHLLALAGGWCGAYWGRTVFRHKTVKTRFVRLFWLTVAANVLLTYLLLSGFAGNFPAEFLKN